MAFKRPTVRSRSAPPTYKSRVAAGSARAVPRSDFGRKGDALGCPRTGDLRAGPGASPSQSQALRPASPAGGALRPGGVGFGRCSPAARLHDPEDDRGRRGQEWRTQNQRVRAAAVSPERRVTNRLEWCHRPATLRAGWSLTRDLSSTIRACDKRHVNPPRSSSAGDHGPGALSHYFDHVVAVRARKANLHLLLK